MKLKLALSYLLVGMVAYTMGTLAVAQAESKAAAEAQLEKKLDTIISNQEEMKKSIKYIRLHV